MWRKDRVVSLTEVIGIYASAVVIGCAEEILLEKEIKSLSNARHVLLECSEISYFSCSKCLSRVLVRHNDDDLSDEDDDDVLVKSSI